MHEGLITAWATVACFVLFAGPARSQNDEVRPRVLVEVNGVPITEADREAALVMDREWNQLQRQGSSSAANAIRARRRDHALDGLIDEVLLVRHAAAMSVTLTSEDELAALHAFDEQVIRIWGSLESLLKFIKPLDLSIETLRNRSRNEYLIKKAVRAQMDGSKDEDVELEALKARLRRQAVIVRR